MYVRRIAFRIRVEPDWSGRCVCSHTAAHSAIAAITGSRKSFGCGLVNRMRSIPSTASTARSSSPKSVRMSGDEVTAPRVHVLAEQRHLAHARHGEPRDLGEDVTGTAALLATANRGDDAVRALRVAAHRDLHPGLEGTLAPVGQLGGERALLGDAEQAPLDSEPACAEPVAQMRDRAGPEGDVHERIELEDPVALRLRVAASDSDHARRVALP